jgi:hypothetical protein
LRINATRSTVRDTTSALGAVTGRSYGGSWEVVGYRDCSNLLSPEETPEVCFIRVFPNSPPVPDLKTDEYGTESIVRYSMAR